MKILGIAFCLCLVAMSCCAEEYYVFIDKVGYVEKGQEAGHTEYGDVVGISPFTPQYKPTRAELSRYKIMVIDLTKQECQDLLASDWEGQKWESEILRARKIKIDIDQLTHIKQEEKVDKATVLQKRITKPSVISP